MFHPNKRQVRMLVSDAVRRVVADAIKSGSGVDLGRSASTIAQSYPACGMSLAEIAKEIAQASKSAHVAVEKEPVGKTERS
jgi:hypothetical protein